MDNSLGWQIETGIRSYVSIGTGLDRLVVRVDSIVAVVLDGALLILYLRDMPIPCEYRAESLEQAQSLYENLLTLLAVAQ